MKAHRPNKIELGNKIYKIVDRTCEFFVYSVLHECSTHYYFKYMGIQFPVSKSKTFSTYDIFEISKVEEVLL
jgi:hypothetical protein